MNLISASVMIGLLIAYTNRRLSTWVMIGRISQMKRYFLIQARLSRMKR